MFSIRVLPLLNVNVTVTTSSSLAKAELLPLIQIEYSRK